jgi:hypothetical protein
MTFPIDYANRPTTPKELLELNVLSKEAKLILLYLKSLVASKPPPLPHPSKVAMLLNLDLSAAMRGFAELVRHSFIEGIPDKYALTDNTTRYSLLAALQQTQGTTEPSKFTVLTLVREYKRMHLRYLNTAPYPDSGSVAIARGIIRDYGHDQAEIALMQFFSRGFFKNYLKKGAQNRINPHISLLQLRNFTEQTCRSINGRPEDRQKKRLLSKALVTRPR